ncbi:hypothetical protein CFK37_11250 [Virgibacillus phasianinus]|uniref:DUF5667 domain-containing protein n=1 Tax=Virgibacillus phasianinus TaxID=2017483 RepID=A0A220U3E6_9BACI|nr:hypothetical protein [Virgibacillus phasianinus]ASK62678.1 hypothetical protein CFK37_11250 [Virgibacillus phasianinus]
MKNKRKFNKALSLSLIFMLFCGFLPSFVGADSVQAKENNGNGGGFIIETEKVEGTINLLQALEGKVEIGEGKIYGLMITKVLNREKGQEPLVIKIKSPGPIPVKNLKAKTVGGTLPNIGGLCVPNKVGWLCLSNVSMTVTEQTVDEISLPNATVETCLMSECGRVAKDNSMSKKEMERMLKKIEKEEASLSETEDGITEDEKQLNQLNQLLAQATETHKKIEKDNRAVKLQEAIRSVSKLLTEPKSSELDQITNLTKIIADEYESMNDALVAFLDELNQIFELQQSLEKSISAKKKTIEDVDNKEQKMNKKQQAEIYSSLLKGEEITKDQDHKNIKEDLKKKLGKFTDEMKSIKEEADDLREKEQTIIDKMKTLKESMKDLKTKVNTLDKENANYSAGFVETLTDYLKEIQVEENVKESAEKNSNEQAEGKAEESKTGKGETEKESDEAQKAPDKDKGNNKAEENTSSNSEESKNDSQKGTESEANHDDSTEKDKGTEGDTEQKSTNDGDLIMDTLDGLIDILP